MNKMYLYEGRVLARPITVQFYLASRKIAAEREAIYLRNHPEDDGEASYYSENFLKRELGASYHSSLRSIPEFNRPIEALRQEIQKNTALSPVNTNTGQKAASPKKVASPKGPAAMEKENPAAVADD